MMGVIEIGPERPRLTQRQRWGHYFVLIYTGIAVLIGINLRDASLNTLVQYIDRQAGIRAMYPKNWLIDTQGSYVFRVRDLRSERFKTTFQVAVQPVATGATARNVLDVLILQRAQLSAYRVLVRRPILLPNEREALAVEYAYVDTSDDAFLADLPVVVVGMDVIVIQRGQAVIITFLSDAESFDAVYPQFERFLDDLVF